MLGEFLRDRHAWRRKPGEWDCATFPAAWAVALGFADPMADFRGAYQTEAQGEDILYDHGGLVALIGPRLRALGWRDVSDGEDFAEGDIGVVELLGHEAGSVYTGRRWALVTDRGLGFVSLERENISAAWRV